MKEESYVKGEFQLRIKTKNQEDLRIVKKALLVILALVTVLAVVNGLVNTVNAASPTQVIGAGIITWEGSTEHITINFHARLIDPATAVAAGQIRETIPSIHGRITGDILYLAVSEDGSKAWIGFVIEEPEIELILEVENDGQISESFPLRVLNYKMGSDYLTIQDAVLDMPDLFPISEVTATLTKIIIR